MFPELPIELQAEITTYLDSPSLCFFARTSWRSLRTMQSHLIRRQQQLLRSPTIKLVTSGRSVFYHTSKVIYAWGDNHCGQLGLGHTDVCRALTRLPQQPPGAIRQVMASDYHSLVLTDRGLYACGFNIYGQLGLGHTKNCTTFTRLEQQPPGVIRQVVAGYDHTVVLTDQGLYACGCNKDGQLGLGHPNSCTTFTRLEQQPPGAILQVMASDYHTLVLTDQGLYACGANRSGQLGLGHDEPCMTLTPLLQQPPGVILQVAVSKFRTLVLTDQGLYACGRNGDGELGLGHTNYCTTFTRLPQQPPGAILQMVTGYHHTLVLTDQGLYACGANRSGQLGLGHDKPCMTLTRLPQQPPGAILQVVACDFHTLVLTDQGLYACGKNSSGELGLRHKKAYMPLALMALILVDQVPSELRQFHTLCRQLNALIRLSQTDGPLPQPETLNPSGNSLPKAKKSSCTELDDLEPCPQTTKFFP